MMADVEVSNLQNNIHVEENKLEVCEVAENNTSDLKSDDSVITNVNNSNISSKSISPEISETNSMETAEAVNPDTNVKEEDEWLDIMGSGNFKKLVLNKGLGHETRPDRGDKVTVSVKYFLDDQILEQYENFQFVVGDMDVIQGLDLVICLMEKEEKARVKIPSKLAYGKIGRSPDIPPESNLECEIELHDVQALDQDSLTVAERLQMGEEKRSRGNFFYERTEYIDAIHCYERAADYLEGIRDSSGSSAEESQKVVDMIIKIYNNMAAAHLKLSAYPSALKSVESVLNIQPKNVKALYRKAKILAAEGSTDEAISCLKFAASIEPETKIIQTELIKLRNLKMKEEQSQKAMYRRMFPQSAPMKKVSSFTKAMKIGVVTAGVMACVGAMAAYRQFHS